MDQIFWAGIGYSPDIADTYWSHWWAKAEHDIERLLAQERCKKQGALSHIPDSELSLCQFQRYFIHGFTWTFADISRVIASSSFRIGFGLLVDTERNAKGFIEEAHEFLVRENITHPRHDVSAWTCSLPRQLDFRRFV